MKQLEWKLPWRKLLVESLVVVASVYVAIVLEGASEARGRRVDALHALMSLRAELALDRTDLDVILAAQKDRDIRHRRLERWLGDVSAMPSDSVTADFRALFSVNRTMFPRNSSWTTMIASGQLSDLDDPILIARLANLYENLNVRLEYNGALYDDWVADVARSAVSDSWDLIEGQLLVSDGDEAHRLRSRLFGLHDLAQGFIGLLEDWGVQLDAVIADVDRYIEREG
jgi:hypothetical protein